MEYSSEEQFSASALPKLRGIECKHVFDTSQRKGIVTLTLRDTSLRGCLDLFGCASPPCAEQLLNQKP